MTIAYDGLPYDGLAPVARAALTRSDDRIVVTGAGGWLGLATLDLLRGVLGDAFDTRVVAFGSSARRLALRGGEVVQRPLSELATLERAPTWVFHYAFLTKDRAAAMDDAAYTDACEAIRTQVLEALDPIGARGIVVASSGAAARADDVDATREMRLYGRLKRADEDAFAAWAEARRTRAVIARIFNVAGPYINKPEAYALASFIRDAQAGRAITVRAPRPVLRGYVAIRELVSLALVLLPEGSGVVRFDSGGAAMELGEVASRVAAVLGGSVARAPTTDDAADSYLGDDAGYAALLARAGIARVPFDTAIAETAAAIAAAQETA